MPMMASWRYLQGRGSPSQASGRRAYVGIALPKGADELLRAGVSGTSQSSLLDVIPHCPVREVAHVARLAIGSL